MVRVLAWDTARGMATALEPIVVACCALDPTFSVRLLTRTTYTAHPTHTHR